jgi:hypothetical protein
MLKRLGRRGLDGELSDAELHRAALAGSGDAMAALYRRHGGLVYRFTLQMSRNEAVVEEIAQEVFLALPTQMERFDAGRGRFRRGCAGLLEGSCGSIWGATRLLCCSIWMKRVRRSCHVRPMALPSYCCAVKRVP